jgi:acyl-CoA thioesterase YciA
MGSAIGYWEKPGLSCEVVTGTLETCHTLIQREDTMTEKTTGYLTTRVLAMPSDTNPAGDISGGWVLSQMDVAAAICAGQRAQTRTVTVALDSMSFIRPVKVGDILGVYTLVESIGRTSMVINVEAWVRRGRIGNREKVTEGKFKFVALDENGVPTPVPPEDSLPDYAKEKLS